MYQKTISIFASFLLLGCSNAIDSAKPSMVIGSGPYHTEFQQAPSAIYRTLTGNVAPDDKFAVLRSGWRFQSKNNPNDKFFMVFLVLNSGSKSSITPEEKEKLSKPYYQAKSVNPGTYVLTEIMLGMQNYDYNSEKCGEITLQVNAGEAVYMGGVYPPSDFLKVSYKSFLPEFKDEGIPTNNASGFEYYKPEDKRLIQSKNLVTRLPVHQSPVSTESCKDIFIPLIDRL
jgi:hypothetical protein